MTTLYGIKNCDTIKKARRWLEQHQIDYQFHDYRKDGLDRQWLQARIEELGWEALVNKRGTTYRQLTDEQKSELNATTALDLMLDAPSIIKRPLLAHGDRCYLGFKPEHYAEVFNAK